MNQDNNYNFDPMTGQPLQTQQQQPVTNQTIQQTTPPVNNTPQKTKKGNKKIILVILIILIIIILLGGGVFSFLKNFESNKTTVDLNAIFDPNRPIVIKHNGKYGYITSEGKTMIEPQYNNATDFYGDYAVVSIDNPDTTSYNEKLYQIIDKKGNVKLTTESYSAPEYYATYNVWVVDDVLYDSKLNKVLSEGITVEYIDYEYFEYVDITKNESGIITYKGKKIFTMPGTSIFAKISENEYNTDDLYASVKNYSETEQEVVISLKTGDILFASEDATKYYISEEDNGIFCYYNDTSDDGYKNRKYLFFINNKLAYKTTEIVDEVEVSDYQNQILEIDYGYDYETLGKIQRIYYYDAKSQKMLDEKPLSPTTDSDFDLIEQTYGFKEYYSSGKYGLMSEKEIIVPCEYDDIEYLDNDIFNYMKSKGKELVLLGKDSKLLLYNLKNSKVITTFASSYVYAYDDSTFIKINLYSEDEYTTTGYMIYNLLSGKSMTFESNDDINIGSNYITIEKDNKITYYNTKFKQIYVSNQE